MNPGTFVMGGGGGGGGSGAGGGKGKGKGQGAGGKDGGNDAQGGGKGAGACGAGNGGACPSPSHGGGGGTSAGDPIDPITGRAYTTPVADLHLPGPLGLSLERIYSTDRAAEDVGLGWGWSHTYALRIREQPRRKLIWIDDPYATPMRVTKPELGARLVLADGAITRTQHGYLLERGELLYVLRTADAVGRTYRLSRVVDRNGNTISLYYGPEGLSSLLDSAGRVVRVRRGESGRVHAFEVRTATGWVGFRSYEYDPLGRLVAALAADGHAERYEYDDDHRLTRRTTAAGIRASFVYDRQGRCTESWCERAGGASGLDADVPTKLADGQPARGFLHVRVNYYDDGFREVVTSRSVRRIEGNALGKATKTVWAGGVHTNVFDEAGRLVEHTDSENHTWRWRFDAEGLLLESQDPAGAIVKHDYDERGETAVLLADGTTNTYQRDASGNLLAMADEQGEIASFTYDARGLMTGGQMPNGGVTSMRYDAFGNRVEVQEPDGGARRIEYDGLGRVIAFTDERGTRTTYAYDPMGRLTGVRTPVAQWQYVYDADGELCAQIDPDGRHTRFERGGFGVVVALIRTDGTSLRYTYDREQDLVRVVDELGAEHRIERDGEGRIVRETTFDGRTLSYKLDSAGRIVRIKYDDGEFTELAYDPVGRLLSRTHSDDLVETFEYDQAGRFTRATSGGVECSFAYDARGNLARQRISDGSAALETLAEFDAVGRPEQIIRPDATTVRMSWDKARRIETLTLGDADWVRFRHAGGLETARELSGGGRVERSYDPGGRVEELFVGRGGRKGGPGEPEWVGDARVGEVVQTFDWTASDRLVAVHERGRGTTTDELDANGRVILRRHADARVEQYGFDAKGSIYQPSQGARRYAPGGRLLQRGDWTYHHDARGCVVRKERGGDKPERWDYEWTVSGRLAKVVGPDVQVELVHDPFARRVSKLVSRDGRVESHTTYGWDGDQLITLDERRPTADGGVDHIAWSFVYTPGDPTPTASRCRVNGAEQPWSYWVHSETEPTPLARIDAAGRVVERIEATLLGKVLSPTALLHRYPGQICDPEIGLHYNGHRYYDPETAQFLTPEPLGLQGSLLPYAYADNYPLQIVDPTGLQPVTTVVTDRQGNQQTAGSGASGSSGPLHPAVAAAMPVDNARTARAPTREGGQAAPPGPHTCGEPRALSDHLFAHEARTGRKCDPGTAAGRRELRRALRNVSSIESTQQTDPPTPRAPCPNCSQTISRLYGSAGLSPPRGSSNGPETSAGNRGSQQSATRVQEGQRMDGTTGTYESPQPGSALAARGDAAQANQAAYQQAVTQAQQGNRPAWNNNANPANPNQPVPPPGTFQHDDGGVWGPAG
jgi:RHS repeat-associated protein